MYPGIDTEICDFAVVWVNFVEGSFWYSTSSPPRPNEYLNQVSTTTVYSRPK